MPTKTLKCVNCKQRFPREEMTKLEAGNFHSIDCIAEYATRKQKQRIKKRQNAALKELRQKKNAEKKKHLEDKERIKTRTQWYDQLQKLVNQYVLHIRDKDKPCCTCGNNSESIKYDAGHFITRAAAPELRFELTNIHKQCSIKCNQYGSGMRGEYRQFVEAVYGRDHLEWLEGKHDLLKDQFPNIEDIKNEIVRYRKLIREHGLKPST